MFISLSSVPKVYQTYTRNATKSPGEDKWYKKCFLTRLNIWSSFCWGIPHCVHFLESVFIINRCWILLKAFSAVTEMIIWFLFLTLLMWCITLIDLQIFKKHLHSWNKSHWSQWTIPWMYYWSWFANILLMIFVSMFIMILACNFLFCDVFIWFLYQGHASFIEWVRQHSFLCKFLE